MIYPNIAAAALGFGCASFAVAQPIIYDAYHTGVFTDPQGPGSEYDVYCYAGGLSKSADDTPNAVEYLAMFSDKFVEHNGRVFAVKNANNDGGFPRQWPFGSSHSPGCPDGWFCRPNGLYEVLPYTGSCVEFELIFSADNIGQIVSNSNRNMDPIQIIGVDQSDGKIYGYYEIPGVGWARKATVWGDAKDGSLYSEPVEDGDSSAIVGVSSNDRMFNLWGDFDNFQYSKKDHIVCAGRPASIDDWSGHLHVYRGVYCPGADTSPHPNYLMKYTWYGDWSDTGPTTEQISWTTVSKISRLGPRSKLWAISTHDKLVVMWNDNGVVKTAPLDHIDELNVVRAVGGLDDGWGHGIFVINGDNKVFSVWWDDAWKAKEMSINYIPSSNFIDDVDHEVTAFFGNYGGKTYLLYGWLESGAECGWAEISLYRFNFVGGTDRYSAESLPTYDYLHFCP